MPLSPEDVIRKSFTTAILRRGYDEKQVDQFLEEVVVELRRLNERTDELEAELASRAQRDPEAEVSERVQREQQQVELIRAERRDLVSEMAGIQARFERTAAETQAAETSAAQAVRAAQEAQDRRAEAEQELESTRAQLMTARAEYDETVAALERAAAELRTLRVAAEEGAGQEALAGVDLPDQPGAQGDLLVVLAVARRMHDDHVEAGRRDGESTRVEAVARAEQLLASAEEQARQRIDEGQAEHDRMVEAAKAQQARLVTDGSHTRETYMMQGQQAREEMLAQARAEHHRLITEAEEQRAGILADLNARRELLETRLAELDRGQADYRQRLRSLVQQQLSTLDDDGWQTEPAPGPAQESHG